MIKGILFLIILFPALLPAAYGNGYDHYPPDLVWSPVEDVLVAALENSLVIWTPYKGSVTVAEGEAASPTFTPDGEWVAFILDGRYTTSRSIIPIAADGFHIQTKGWPVHSIQWANPVLQFSVLPRGSLAAIFMQWDSFQMMFSYSCPRIRKSASTPL